MPIHLEQGARDTIAFVFSCPGRHEQAGGQPAAGPTGSNLEDALRSMRGYGYGTIENVEGDDWTRENVLITNAWPCVEFNGQTGRSQPRTQEVLSEGNLSRLAEEIGAVREVIVCCGKNAKKAVSSVRDRTRLRDGVRVVFLPHLSNRALNGWIPNRRLPESIVQGAGSAKAKSRLQRRERVRRWASCLHHQISTVPDRNPTV